MARGKKPRARRKPVPRKRRTRTSATNGGGIPSSARKSRGFEERPAEEVRPDDAEFLH